MHDYLDLLKAALWKNGEGLTNERLTNERLDELIRLNILQGTGTLVFPYLLHLSELPALARAQMKSVCMQNMQNQAQISRIQSQALDALAHAGIEAVLMKGAGLAALYPEPYYRSWGDVDLFVGKEQYHPACAVMRDTFPDALKFEEELDHYKHYNIIADGVSIETHRVTIGFQHPIDARRYARMEAYGVRMARTLEIEDCKLKVFEPTFNALFVFLHSMEHMLTQGASLRQLCDLALLLHHEVEHIDRRRLRHWLCALHLTDMWRLYMFILVNGLGLSQDEAPFYPGERLKERGERMLVDLLAGRMHQSKSQESAPKNRIARKWFTMQERLSNARRIARYSPSYARHRAVETLLHGALRFFAKDRFWE